MKFGCKRGDGSGAGKDMVKVWKLDEGEIRRRYMEGLRLEWERVKYSEVGSLEGE